MTISRNLSKIQLALLVLSAASVLAYRELDLKSNPFACPNECAEDEQPNSSNHIHKVEESHLKDDGCYATNHTITNLPYWNESQPQLCMYSGTFNVSLNNDQDHNLFYWHFKNTSLTNASLIIWINGGPGSSSMFGLFLENGPIRLSKNGTGSDDWILGLAPHGSWLEFGDMVFIDQPVGTGFSYGNDYLTKMDDGASEFINFLKAFLTMYPEYQTRKVFLSGESYAGKYIPQFAVRIDKYNSETHDNVHTDPIFINLEAVLIGDPFVSPVRQRTSTHLVAQGVNIIDNSNMGQIHSLRKRCEQGISDQLSLGSRFCGDTMDYIDDVAGGLFTYDGTIFDYDWAPIGDPVDYFLAHCNRSQEFYEAIHINQSTKRPIYEPSSELVAENYDAEEMIDWSKFYDGVLDQGTPMLVYAGEYDQRDGPLTQEGWMADLILARGNGDHFFNQSRQIYYFRHENDIGYKVGGYYRFDSELNFTFLTVPKSGHFVPTNYLEATKFIIKDYINQTRLVCHHFIPSMCDTNLTMCKYMNQCSGNGMCLANGMCKCSDGYKSADCSEKVQLLTNGSGGGIPLNGTQWTYFQYKGGDLEDKLVYQWNLSSEYVMDVYISEGLNSEPTEFRNTMEFRKQSILNISSIAFPTLRNFVAAVRVNGYQSNGHIFNESTLRFNFSVYDPDETQNLKNHNSLKKSHLENIFSSVKNWAGSLFQDERENEEMKENGQKGENKWVKYEYLAGGVGAVLILVALKRRKNRVQTVTKQ